MAASPSSYVHINRDAFHQNAIAAVTDGIFSDSSSAVMEVGDDVQG